MPIFEWRSVVPTSADEVFAYHARPGAFRRLAPPWQKMKVLEDSGDVTGGRVAFDVWFGPVRRRWVAEMGSAIPGRQFVDRQVEGPFASWEHTHRFVPIDEGKSELLDHVEYSLPAGGLTDIVGEVPAGKALSRVFRFRHERTRLDLGRHAQWADRPRLRVAIAGASGLIGSHLADYLTTAGHGVVRLVRNTEAGPDEIPWDPSTGALYHGALEGVDAIINLAAVTLNGIWTPRRKKAILESRVQATSTLAEAIARMDSPPSVFISVSAVGAYGSRGGEVITEQTPTGTGFLADVCRAWEEAAMPARDAGVRLVTPRQGIVISAEGGALATMSPLFRAGIGGRLGDGRQYWAWAALDDLLAAFEWALHDEELEGVVNFTSPEPLTNREVTQTLGRVLRHPAALAAPAFVLRHGLGGMGDEMLLASQRAMPARLKERGFRFAFPKLEGALRYELGRS
jgi:uncharacterized protein (TIGR01777 family)